MRYVSLFSGIEAATVAWEPLGFEPVAFSEVEPFCCDLLAARYPNVPNLGDISKIDWSGYAGAVDVVVGGSPCQAFSIAGKRGGLMDERGQLMLEYVRAIREVRPRWCVWENVPGVLSQSQGDAFETLLNELEQCGYSLAWRVLDAQYFGLAQRRRRVFVVGHSSAGCAAAVLLERQSMCWDIASGRAKREALTKRASGGANSTSVAINTAHTKQSGTPFSEELAHTLDCASPCAVVSQYGDVAGTITSRNDSSPCADRGQTVIAFQPEASASQGLSVGEISPTLGTTKTPAVVTSSGDDLVGSLCACDYKGVGSQSVGEDKVLSDGTRVRRLTPVECERLQGFPDNYTQLGDTKDTPRYKALGNSMAVPVMRWIGERIEIADNEATNA